MLRISEIIFITCFIVDFVTSAPSKLSTNGDVSPCLQAFYKSVYSEQYNCTQNFDFLSDVPSTKQKAYTSGKACLFEITKEECSESQFHLLSTKYDEFLDVMLTKPSDETSCTSFYFKYNALKCEPMITELGPKVMLLNMVDTKINDTRVLNVIDHCEKIKACIKPACYVTEQEKQMVDDVCEAIGMKNTEFTYCALKIMKQSPDLSEYECLDGFDFYDKTPETLIEKFSTKKECTKTIMQDICGKQAVENFNNYADITVKNLKKSLAVSNALAPS